MFDIGWGELVVIGIVALIAIGPKELPGMLRTLGQYMAKIKRMSAEFQSQFQEALREAEVADIKNQAEHLTSSVTDLVNLDPAKAFEPATEIASEPAVATDNVASPAAPPAGTANEMNVANSEATIPQIDLPLPEAPAQISNEDFAGTPLPPPKHAGGNA